MSVTHFEAKDDTFPERARSALAALAARPGYLRGSLARTTDPADDERAEAWVLVTEWANVGSYRRALGGFEVKMVATPLLAEALDLPTSFESLVSIGADGAVVEHPSDREPTGFPALDAFPGSDG
jgi:hypothetical protein